MSKFLRPVQGSDLSVVGRNMRQADHDECYAAAGMPGELALSLSVRVSESSYTMVNPDGLPVGICGVAPGHTPSDRQVWMLATNDIIKHRILFLRESRVWFEDLASRFMLWNWVDERNTLHIEWLKWLGCDFPRRKLSPYTGTNLIFFTKV